jgi:hypothetical protein
MAATVAGVYVCYRLVLPFVPAFAWAPTFAALFAPARRWNEARLKGATSRPASPSLWSRRLWSCLDSGRLVDQAARGTIAIRAAIDSGQWRQVIEAHTSASLVRGLAIALCLEPSSSGSARFVFGASGVILGPLAVTITLSLLEIWRVRTSRRAPGAR